MEIFLIAIFALGVLLAFSGLARRAGEPARIDQVMQVWNPTPWTLQEAELAQPFSERVLKPFLRVLASIVSRFTPQRNAEATRHSLELAGNPYNWTVADFLGLRALFGIFTAALMGVVFLFINGQPLIVIGMLCVGGILGFLLPFVWLRMKIRRRQDNIERALPDALDLLTISVEAGLGFDSALQRVAEQWDNELGNGFARALAEIRIGKLRSDALRDMASRMEVPDVTTFCAAVIQTDILGVPIAKVLRIQSEQMRIKRRQRAEEKANKAPIRMLFPLVFLIFPAIYIVLLGPVVIRFLGRGFMP